MSLRILLIIFSGNESDNMEYWYGVCFGPQDPPSITLQVSTSSVVLININDSTILIER